MADLRRALHLGGLGRLVVTGVSVIAMLVGVAPAYAAPKPPNTSDQQISAAQARKDKAARSIGTISARIAQVQSELDRLNSAAQLAEQRLALALQRKREATASAVSARRSVTTAQSTVDHARRQFISYVQLTYMNGSLDGTAGVLLTANNPSSLMQQSALHHYVSTHQLDAIGQLDRATVVRSNADAAARRALQRQTRAASQAATAQQNVLTALSQAQSAKTGLQTQLSTDQQQLQAAQIALTGITNQRAAYVAWKKQQAILAAQEAERKRQMRLRQQRAAAAAAARLQAQHTGTTGGSGHRHKGGGGGGGGSSAPSPSGGSWSAAKGRDAVRRAMPYLGMRYSWAAGNSRGPTYGVSEPGNAWNDSNILGFDCSGLTLYAWAPYLSMDHYAATQYGQAGSYHPSIDNLMPGDLVFWSGDGSQSGIGHEAMYIGGGNVIQAPQSGDVIKITNIYNVENGYFGATRPLT